MKVTALFFVIVASGLIGTTSGICAEARSRVRIVTFNAHCLAAPETRASRIPRFRWDFARFDHLERVANVIETLEPDILNLLEVTSAEAVNALVEILHAKGLEDYQGYHAESTDRFTGFDVALITRLRPDIVEGSAIRCLSSPPGDPTWREKFLITDKTGKEREQSTLLMRNALYFFTIGTHRLGFLGLHLKSDPSNDIANSRRTGESIIAQRAIRKEIVARNYLPIVLGDLNDYDPDVPDHDDSRSTKTTVLSDLKNYDPSTTEPELVNPASKILRLADRSTSHWDRNENGVADSADVFTMIDYILLPQELMPLVRRVFVARCTELTTSDHWPVVVDLELPDA